MNWYQMESQEVMDKLNRFKDRGLSQKEVIKRQRHYGKNELQSEKGPGFFRQFAAQFKDFMILTLLAAAGISFFASYAQGEMNLTDPLIILAIVILNALLGIYQEKKAEHSLAHLRSLQTPQCQVLRDGKRQTISSPELVPGDLVYLDTGCLVPADGRLLLTHNLSANESALTGETGSIEKTSGSLHIENLSLGDQLNMGIFGHNDYDRKWAVLCYRNRYEYANWENRRYAFTRTGTADTSYQAPQSYRKSAWHPGPDYLCHSIFSGIAEKPAGF